VIQRKPTCVSIDVYFFSGTVEILLRLASVSCHLKIWPTDRTSLLFFSSFVLQLSTCTCRSNLISYIFIQYPVQFLLPHPLPVAPTKSQSRLRSGQHPSNQKRRHGTAVCAVSRHVCHLTLSQNWSGKNDLRVNRSSGLAVLPRKTFVSEAKFSRSRLAGR
jgi:hypothetical protein